jgi:hypothetical protein
MEWSGILLNTGLATAPAVGVLLALLAHPRRKLSVSYKQEGGLLRPVSMGSSGAETEEHAPKKAPIPVAVHADTVPTDHTPLWAAFVGAVGAIGAAMIARNNNRKKSPEERESDAVINGLAKITNIIARLSSMEEHGAERIVLFRGHNGGGYPTPGMPFYVSASQWHTAKGHDGDAIGNYRNIMVDNEYIKMLIAAWMDERKYLSMVTGTMPQCQLRRWYEAEGVTASAVFVMGIQDKSLFYLSAAKYGGEFTESELTSIQLATNGIWQDMKGQKP